MASSSVNSSLSHPISEKLTRDNFLLWKDQVLPAVCGAQLMGYLDGTIEKPDEMLVEGTTTKPNPAYAAWMTHDQQVLSYLKSSMSREVLVQVTSFPSAAEVWSAVTEMYSS